MHSNPLLKKATFSILFSLLLITSATFSQCKIAEIVDQGKLKIAANYLYDGFTLTQFTLNNETKVMQTEFTALKGQEYKVYFCTSGFDEELTVSIKSDKSDEKLLDQKVGKEPFEFELTKAGNYIVEYNIPLAENAEYGNIKNECVLMLISFKHK